MKEVFTCAYLASIRGLRSVLSKEDTIFVKPQDNKR